MTPVMFLWIPFLVLVPFAIVWLVRQENGAAARFGVGHGTGSSGAPIAPATPTRTHPIEIARLRLARGEITTAEYDELRRLLG